MCKYQNQYILHTNIKFSLSSESNLGIQHQEFKYYQRKKDRRKVDSFVPPWDGTLLGQGLYLGSNSSHREVSQQAKLTSLFGSCIKFLNKAVSPQRIRKHLWARRLSFFCENITCYPWLIRQLLLPWSVGFVQVSLFMIAQKINNLLRVKILFGDNMVLKIE